jgi:hypothetical protein
VKGAEFDSPERVPHPKCLQGTRVELLKHIYELLDNQEKSQLIWLHGTAGVGKSAVASIVAEKMTEETTIEKGLGGTFFFSRKHTKRCTTGYFFATLAYQLVNEFQSVREDSEQNNPRESWPSRPPKVPSRPDGSVISTTSPGTSMQTSRMSAVGLCC